MRARVMASLVLAVVVGACGGSDTKTIVTPGGRVQVTEDGESYHAVTKDGDGNEVVTDVRNGELSITSDKGSVKMGASRALEDLGVALYPGAEVPDDGMLRIETPEGLQCTVTLRTRDARAKVVEFYKGHLAKVEIAAEMDDAASVAGSTSDGTHVTIVVSPRDDGEQEIVISTSRTR